MARAFYDEDGFATTDAQLRSNFGVLLQSDTAHIALALVDDVIAGFALTTTAFILESGLVAELQDLYAVPDRRAIGVGSALIDDAMLWARSQSATQLQVVVAPNGRDVSSLIDYYRSRGFLDEGRRLLMQGLSVGAPQEQTLPS